MSPLAAVTVLGCLLVHSPPQGGEVGDPATAVLQGVTVIDVRAPTPARARLADRDVWLAGDRIEAIVPAGWSQAPEGARLVDGHGAFLVPGLWDMHVHLDRDDATVRHVMGPLMVAHGVTGVRDMQSDCFETCPPGKKDLAEMRAMAARFESGEWVGPRLLALSSDIVWGPGTSPAQLGTAFFLPETAQEGRALARRLRERGVDLVKIYNGLPRDAFFGLLSEARTFGLPVAGHLPWSVRMEEAAEAGMASIEHARWPALACNPAYEEFRAAFAEYAAGRRPDFPQDEFVTLREAAVPDFDEERCRAIARALAAAGTALVPTHVTREMDARADDPAYRADPRRRWIPEPRLRAWDRDLDATAVGGGEMRAFYRGLFELGLRATGIAHEEGVRVLAGTDTPDTQCFPGSSLHDELVHLAHAGLSPLDVLRAATLRAAELLGLDERYGAVEVGRAADLVLLAADPLLDVAAVRSIRAVVLRGRILERAELDALLQGVEAYSHPSHEDLPLPADAERLYAGTWIGDGDARVDLEVREGHLGTSFDGSPSYGLSYQGEHRFRLEADPRVELAFTVEDGRTVELLVRRDDTVARYRRR